MKAKTKLQQRVYSLSQRLAPISERQKEWAFQHCFDHYGRRTKKGTASCLECGYEWFDKTLKPGPAVCPHCGRTIEIIETRKRRFKRDEAYYCILTTCGGCQVIRFFDLYVTRHVGREAWYGCQEVVQLWITPAGKVVSIARLRPMLSWYRDSWNWSSPLEVRPYKMCYDITPGFIYPRKSVIPALFTGFLRCVCSWHSWITAEPKPYLKPVSIRCCPTRFGAMCVPMRDTGRRSGSACVRVI